MSRSGRKGEDQKKEPFVAGGAIKKGGQEERKVGDILRC